MWKYQAFKDASHARCIDSQPLKLCAETNFKNTNFDYQNELNENLAKFKNKK
jgi:hypothetical protein